MNSGGPAIAAASGRNAVNSSIAMRGFNIASVRSPTPLVEADYAAMAQYGAKVGRIALTPTLSGSTFVLSAADQTYMTFAASMAVKYKFWLIIVLAPQPDGQVETWWTDATQSTSLVTLWQTIATQFVGHPEVWAYDLLNEPVQPKDRNTPVGSTEYWRPLAVRMIQAIQAIDSTKVCMFEPSPYGKAAAFWPGGTPLVPFSVSDSLSNVIYSCHFYDPQELTNQMIPGSGYTTAITYPSTFPYTSTYLSNVIQYVRLFKAGYPTEKVFFGEFSCDRYSPLGTPEAWLNDFLLLIQTEGWTGGCYHSWREYDGWDAELTGNAQGAGTRVSTAPMITILKNWFNRNK